MNEIYIMLSGDNFGLSRNHINDNFSTLSNQVDLVVSGMDWQESVISIEELSNAIPAEGSRYIASQNDVSTNHTWVKDYIYEWSIPEDNWIGTAPTRGMITFIEDVNTIYVYDGISWSSLSTFISHNQTIGVSGGIISERFHFTQSEHNILTNGQDAQSLHFHDTESLSVPVTDNSVGTKQEWILSGNYLYNCIDTDTWVRSPVETVFP